MRIDHRRPVRTWRYLHTGVELMEEQPECYGAYSYSKCEAAHIKCGYKVQCARTTTQVKPEKDIPIEDIQTAMNQMEEEAIEKMDIGSKIPILEGTRDPAEVFKTAPKNNTKEGKARNYPEEAW